MKRSYKKIILLIIGTRPEVIKMWPIYNHLNKSKKFIVKICFTGQHKELANVASNIFLIKPDYHFNIMKKGQNLSLISQKILNRLSLLLKKNKIDIVCVQGDTSTAMIGALSAFYEKKNIVHIESGLRTHNKFSPYPEEVNRKIITDIADFHFAPTILAKNNLLKQRIFIKNIFVVGNTVINSLKKVLKDYNIKKEFTKQILCTIHRNENQGKNLKIFCKAINRIAKRYPDWIIFISVHPNPKIRDIIKKNIIKNKNILVHDALNYVDFIKQLSRSSIILTNSGGVQEECAYLGKCVLILREYTERVEIIKKRIGKIINVTENDIVKAISDSITNKIWINIKPSNCFGSGNSGEKISKVLEKIF